MAKQGLWANINRRKRLGISRPKSKTTISKEAYANMKKGFPKKMANGGMTSEQSNEKYYKQAREKQNKFRKSEKELDRKYKENQEKEREFDYLNMLHPEDSTIEQYKKGGIARGCGKVMENRRKFTKVY